MFSFRQKATTTNFLDTNSRGDLKFVCSRLHLSLKILYLLLGTLTQTSTSTVSDYLSGGKKPPSTINNFNNTTATTRQDARDHKYGNRENRSTTIHLIKYLFVFSLRVQILMNMYIVILKRILMN